MLTETLGGRGAFDPELSIIGTFRVIVSGLPRLFV